MGFGIVRIQTDDTLILALDNFSNLKESKLTKANLSTKLKQMLIEETLLIFNRCIVT